MLTVLANPAVANVVQIFLAVVTVGGLWVALLNGKKDRATAMSLAAADRRAADERAESDRREANAAVEDERIFLREQAQLQMQLDHALKIVQTAENYPRGDFNTIKHWGLSIRASVIVLGKDLVPQAWSVFIDRENRWEDMQDEVLQEVNDLAIQTARTLNCPSCYHVHRNTLGGRRTG
ncbi:MULTISPECIES: hypothetical protein [unclassified Arthrobacter]|uniref:hypothetical protein n=1 Tax=unclassified Arthrobacter TaxID=235627 RepID=UPI001C865E12|nr:hypothetical protein [Arthrobacter sp. MAHUQ-56]MBX7443373.1 hypothetical protein [Arthrobacter sp. MAHUQ-56]